MKRRFKSIFEREERGKIQKLEIFLALLVWIGIAWLAFNSPNQQVQNIAFGFNILMTIVAIFWLFDLVDKNNIYVESIGFGSWNKFAIAGIAGVIFAIAFFLFGINSNVKMIVPFATTSLAGFALLAAWIEEMFFRSVLSPTFGRFFGNDLIAFGGNFVLFAGFHFLAYGALIPAMLTAGVFGTIMLAGNTFFKSTAFGYSSHILYNFLIITFITGVI